MALQVLDPTSEWLPQRGHAARRLDTLAGKTIGFVSNGKEGTHGFFAHLDRLLRDTCSVANVIWRVKSNYSAPADRDIVDEIARWHAVVTGIGD